MQLFPIINEHYNQEIKTALERERHLVLSGIGNPTAKSFVMTDLHNMLGKKLVWITADDEELIEVSKDISLWFNGQLYRITQESSEAEIMHALAGFFESDDTILFIEKACLKNQFPHIEVFHEYSQLFKVGDKYDQTELMTALLGHSYEFSDETVLPVGTYRGVGEKLEIHPLGTDKIYRMSFGFDTLESIELYDPVKKEVLSSQKELNIVPAKFPKEQRDFFQMISPEMMVVMDEFDEDSDEVQEKVEAAKTPFVKLTSFPRDNENYFHLRYLSVLKFYTLPDLLEDIRSKLAEKWKVFIYSKRFKEMTGMLEDENMKFSSDLEDPVSLKVLEASDDEYLPASFQNPNEKIIFITDKEIFSLKKAARNQSVSKMSIDFITSLNAGDYIVHFDHGVGQFDGIVKRKIGEIEREYLEIKFQGNDCLFIPVDQSDKISKHVMEEGTEVVLSKLGGAEWQKQVKKAKKETEALAKELLELYAKRAQLKRDPFVVETDRERAFAKSFPYKETPGQMKAILDVRRDMENPKPMDRLVCGDVGFGKTEVAMRAAFKAVESGRQVALISPVTILTEQHYLGLKKRVKEFGTRVEMLSRFKTEAEQNKVLEKLRKGEVDIVVGTHRLLQKDVEFLNLGLVIVDEEQRFGVKQKEALKNLRSQVDVLTLTATPIPRTLNMSLNKLRDITTITTPPPGRLPIITEVRKYSDQLVREAILKELDRNGQIYFLHNRVETIEGMAEKLRTIVPEATFVVAHGQMSSRELEERILAFKRGEFDVLISSTIIENGIDLANANTMIINNAEKFGLSQLYQLRGRIGRSSKQAYAYMLYHRQKLPLDARKRLRAIVEASELGAGFQIAMRDLEIRGAGEILGSSQSGAMTSMGVAHFMKLLQKTVKEMKNGTYVSAKDEPAPSDIAIELPISALIPKEYIADEKEKLNTYQKLASVDTFELLEEFYQDIRDEYGKMPKETENLFSILKLKMYARTARVGKVMCKNGVRGEKELQLILSEKCTPEFIMKALEYNPRWVIYGNMLKIDLNELGKDWFIEVMKTVEAMAK